MINVINLIFFIGFVITSTDRKFGGPVIYISFTTSTIMCGTTKPIHQLARRVYRSFRIMKLECIPVGCVPPTAVAVGGASPPETPLDQALPVDRRTPVNILPCPKLRLQAVIIESHLLQFDEHLFNIAVIREYMLYYCSRTRFCNRGWQEQYYFCTIN